MNDAALQRTTSHLATEFRVERARRGWDQADVAERVGVTQAAISLLERTGVASLQLLVAVADVFGLRLRLAPAETGDGAPSPEDDTERARR